MICKTLTLTFFFGLVLVECNAQQPLYSNEKFKLYADSIVQGNFVGKAASATRLTSNYQSPANDFLSPVINFKFSINRKDNEMPAGVNHQFRCDSETGVCETPLIQFGTQLRHTEVTQISSYLKPNSKLQVNLDMRAVLAAFKRDGFYSTYNGDKIYAADFKGLYVAGETTPLSWDFDNLHQKPALEMKDVDGDGIYTTTILLNETREQKDLAAAWELTKDVSAYPTYSSGRNLPDALYNLALEEMIRAIEPDSTFRTGKEWAGVWTRDISYSIILSMAYMQPEVAMKSLMRKVKNKRIVQDTGTGGAYPNSTDRIVWAIAAFEIYKVTGNKNWLVESFEIIRNSIEDDIVNADDKASGLVRGESSFLDWREQTYPRWMQPADIYESECLGTNVLHFQSNKVLAQMAGLLQLKTDSVKYTTQADQIRDGINKNLWLSEKKFYGQYLYGRNYKTLSPRSEALGEALAVLYGVADSVRQREVIQNTFVTPFGIPCIYPQINDIPPYHNNAVWPFVQSFWALAAAKAGNETSVLESIAAVYRPAALFLTDKENFVASNGDYKGTVINSDNMLWSLAGSLSIVHRLIMGISFDTDRLLFKPFIPNAFAGTHQLRGFQYRNSILDITVEGSGNQIQAFLIDGKEQPDHHVPANLNGRHAIKISLNSLPKGNNPKETSMIEVRTTVATPVAKLRKNIIEWSPIPGALTYVILKNGKTFSGTSTTEASIPTEPFHHEWQVIAVDKQGMQSFASEPLVMPAKELRIEMETAVAPAVKPFKGFSGNGFVETSQAVNKVIVIPFTIEETGMYAIDFRYANGNGPTNTDNKCGIRSLQLNKKFIGTIVFPQRGSEEWSNWGFTNAVKTELKKGKHILRISLEAANANMNGEINQAMIDWVRFRRLR